MTNKPYVVVRQRGDGNVVWTINSPTVLDCPTVEVLGHAESASEAQDICRIERLRAIQRNLNERWEHQESNPNHGTSSW